MTASGRITTFYSYKGGTGRSMALANFAWTLAANGSRVLVIDWDLEAPGLHRYFRPFLIDPDLVETNGLIDAFWNLAALGLQTLSAPAESQEDRLSVEEIFDAVTRRLNCKKYFGAKTDDGFIDFICAGQQGKAYSERVTTFDWRRFYELGGAAMLEAAKTHFRARYDWILIDSRTGVSDTSGICTMQMPSVVVPCFTLNRQSIDGVAAILRSIRDYQSATVIGSEIDFYPVATRIENAEDKRLQIARRYARAVFAQYLPPSYRGQDRGRDYWTRMEISYRPKYAFEETLAVFGDGTGSQFAPDSMLNQLHELFKLVTANPDLKIPDIEPAEKDVILEAYGLEQSSAATADRKAQRAAEEQQSWDEFVRNLRAKEWKWRRLGQPRRLLLSHTERTLLGNRGGAGEWSESGSTFRGYDAASETALGYDRFLRWAQAPVLLIAAAFAWLIFSRSWFPHAQSAVATAAMLSSAVLTFDVVLSLVGCMALGWYYRAAPYRPPLFGALLLALEGAFAEPIRDYARYDGVHAVNAARFLRPAAIVVVPAVAGPVLAMLLSLNTEIAVPVHPVAESSSNVPPLAARTTADVAKLEPPLAVEINSGMLKSIMPAAGDPERWVTPLNEAMRHWKINTAAREAGFLADFAYQTKSLNEPVMVLKFRTTDRLMSTWKSAFPNAAAAKGYLGNEEKLADFVFRNWKGNGDQASGDGYRFRPRGMLFGRTLYEGAAAAFDRPEYLTDPDSISTPNAIKPDLIAQTSAWAWIESGQAAAFDEKNNPLGYLSYLGAHDSDSLKTLQLYWTRAEVALKV